MNCCRRACRSRTESWGGTPFDLGVFFTFGSFSWNFIWYDSSACRGIGITVSLHSLVLSGTGFQNSLVRRMPHSNCPSWPGESAASAMRAESRRPGRADENRLASETVETTSESGVPRSCLTSMRLATAREGRREPPPVPGAPRAPPEGRRIAFHGPLPLPFCFAWAFACVSRYCCRVPAMLPARCAIHSCLFWQYFFNFCWVGWWLRASLKKSSALMMYTRVVLVVTTDTACFVLFTSACSPKNCPGPMMLISRSLGAHPAWPGLPPPPPPAPEAPAPPSRSCCSSAASRLMRRSGGRTCPPRCPGPRLTGDSNFFMTLHPPLFTM